MCAVSVLHSKTRGPGFGGEVRNTNERSRLLPTNSEFQYEREGSMCARCRCCTPKPRVPGLGIELGTPTSGRVYSQTILNSNVRGRGLCVRGVGAALQNPGSFAMCTLPRLGANLPYHQSDDDIPQCILRHGLRVLALTQNNVRLRNLLGL